MKAEASNFKLQDIYQLDPLAGTSMEEIMIAYANQAIMKKTFIIHSNISEFVDLAREMNNEFSNLTLMEKKAIISQIADQWIANNQPRTIANIGNANTTNP